MFKIKAISECENSPFSDSTTQRFLEAFRAGMKADRMVQKNLIDLEGLYVPGTELIFKITYLHDKDRAAVVRFVEDKNLIKIYVEPNQPKRFSGSGYEFLIYPSQEIATAQTADIEEQVQSQIFMFAYILLKLSSDYEFCITRDQKKMNTSSPAVALYETLLDQGIKSTIIHYNEPYIFEKTDVTVDISKENEVIQVSGYGTSSLHITLAEILANMTESPLEVVYTGV
jgi:hypothetical protein